MMRPSIPPTPPASAAVLTVNDSGSISEIALVYTIFKGTDSYKVIISPLVVQLAVVSLLGVVVTVVSMLGVVVVVVV